MAKVLERAGFRFFIWSNDHWPPHVHVRRGGTEMTILLGNAHQKPSIREIGRSFRDADAARALKMVAQMQDYLLKKWSEIHGRDKDWQV